MLKYVAFAGAAALGATTVEAGGIDQSRLNYGALFEPGNYVEFGAAHVMPTVKGRYANPAFGRSTGNMANSHTSPTFTLKQDITDRISYALFLNAPYGANAHYPSGFYEGLRAKWDNQQAALVFKYKVPSNFSVYGGVKAVRSKAKITLPDNLVRGGLSLVAQNPNASPADRGAAQAIISNSPGGSLQYNAKSDYDTRLGVIVGAAYERPDIALRVGLTYESGFTHKLDTTEVVTSPVIAGLFGKSTTRIKMPQTVTLDFQSGVAKDTLLFGSVRWSEWSVWEVRPKGYETLTGTDITEFSNDVVTYQLGIGRKLNDTFSVFARGSYEKKNGGEISRLSPVDGRKSFGIGGTYTKDAMKITAGIEYIKLGSARDSSKTKFKGNDAIAFGMTVGYRF